MNIEEKESVVKKSPVFLTGLLTIILIITFIFTLKNYEPVKNIIITGGIVTYPLSFLIVSFINRYYGFKETKKSILISSLLFIIFFLLVVISIMPSANEITSGYNAIVQYIFASGFKEFSWGTLFYPAIGQFLGILISYFSSHLLFATIHSVTKEYTVDHLAMGLGLLISYIVDRIIFVPIYLSKSLIKGSTTFNYLIQILTSEFIAAIFTTLILILVYVIFTSIKKSKN